MNPAMLKSMRAKKKRPVDPDAPPRPNLLSHDKKLRDQEMSHEELKREVYSLRDQLESLKIKLNLQDNLVSQLLSRLLRR
jgi:hypothetical protein